MGVDSGRGHSRAELSRQLKQAEQRREPWAVEEGGSKVRRLRARVYVEDGLWSQGWELRSLRE